MVGVVERTSTLEEQFCPCVTFNPFYCMAFALDGLPGQLDIMSIA